MINMSKAAVIAAVAFGGIALQSTTASAIPMVDAAPAVLAHGEGSGLQQAFWHGGWHRHHGWHRHYGWHRPWGWHRHYGWHHRWRHWG